MTNMIVLDPGSGGRTPVCEGRKEKRREQESVCVDVSMRSEFTPSNAPAAVVRCAQKPIAVDLPETMQKHGIECHREGV